MFDIKKFLKGLKIVPKTTSEVDSQGELEVLNTDGKLRYHNGTTVSPVVTETHTATLENKTIDADDNTISNLEVDNLKAGVLDTDLTSVSLTDDTIPSAKAVKGLHDSHVNETTAAHEASAVSVTAVGNLIADDVQEALEDHQTNLDTLNQAVSDLTTLSGVPANDTDLGTFTGSTISDSATIKQALQDLETEVELKLDASEVGVSVASLVAGKVPASQLPNAIMEYQGTYNASTNTPTLADGVGNADEAIGNVYRVTVAGTQDFGSGSITFAVGDYVILNSSKVWEKADTTDNPDLVSGPVSSVDNTIARFDGTTGKAIQGSNVTIDDADILSGATRLNVDNLRLDGNVVSSTNSNGNIDITPNGTGVINANKDVRFHQDVAFEITDDSTAGANVTLATPATKTIRLTGAVTSIDMIPAGSNGQEIVIINATGSNISINNNTGGTAANRILTGQQAAITLKDEASIPLIYDSTEARWMVAAGVGSSSGSSGINYILAPDADTSVGWAAYADAASNTPVDGTGGSPTTTLTTTTSSPLRGVNSFLITKDAANRQGEGVSYDFTIDTADKYSILRISFDYVSSANYADGDYRIYIYDVTNSTMIELATRDLYANTNAGHYIGEFQASNSTSYRLIYHCASTNATAYTIKFDNVQVGPRSRVTGPIVTDWVSFSSTLNSNTSVLSNTAKYRRVGDSMEAVIEVIYNGVGNSSTFTATIPSGLVMDSTKYTSGKLGEAYHAGTVIDEGTTVVNSTTSVKFVVDAASAFFNTSSTINGSVITLKFTAPIVGWAANMTLSEGFGTRNIVQTAQRITSAQTITSGSDTEIIFNRDYNFTGQNATGGISFSTSTGRATAEESGWYDFDYMVRIVTSATASSEVVIYAKRNGTDTIAYASRTSLVASKEYPYAISGKVYLNKGDYIACNVAPTAQPVNVSIGSRFFISKIQSPQTLAGGEVVAASYETNAGQAVGDSTEVTIVFEDKIVDTHNAMNTSTGLYTVPMSGIYRVDSNFCFAGSTGWNIAEVANNYIYVNATLKSISSTVLPATSASSISISPGLNTYIGSMLAGDIIKVNAYQTSGASINLNSTGSRNYIRITKIG